MSYFISPNYSPVWQVLLLFLALSLNTFVAIKVLKRSRFYSISFLWLALNFVFIVPFFVSISSGSAGFASVINTGLNPLVLGLYTVQVFCLPLCLLLGGYISFTGPIYLGGRFKQQDLYVWAFVVFSAVFFLLHFFWVKPGLYWALRGDISTALNMRVVSHIGDAAAHSSAPKILNYNNITRPMLQCSLLALFFYSRKKFFKVIFVCCFLFVSFSTFSKGALAGCLVLAAVMSSYFGDKEPKIRKLLVIAVCAPGLLVAYMWLVTPHAIDTVLGAIYSRFYNNSSSVYLQIELFGDYAPLGVLVNDWGGIGRLFGVGRLIPKEEVYPYIFPSQSIRGQAGSLTTSEAYFFAGYFFPLFLLVLFIIVAYIDNFLKRTRDNCESLSDYWVRAMVIGFGFNFVVNIFNSPFGVLSPFTFFRLEMWFWLITILLGFRFMSKKKMSTSEQVPPC